MEFLRQVAAHYAGRGDTPLEKICFVMPSRRSIVTFRHYLAGIMRGCGRPVICPALYTVNDFFYALAGKTPTDHLTLLLELYDCYKELYPRAEPLDEFLFWGDVILSDYSEIDRYMVNPVGLFTNITELKSISDDWSALSPAQRKAINDLISHLREGGRPDMTSTDPGVKEKFLGIWSMLGGLYNRFRTALEASGHSYDGMVYRHLAENIREEGAGEMLRRSFPDTSKVVFVGLNALSGSEKTILRRFERAGLAEFCWDYSSQWIKDPRNASSHFMESNVREFPQAFLPDDGVPPVTPDITVLSVPSCVGQAKQLPQILRHISGDNLPSLGIETAVILPDENLLVPVLNSIPPELDSLNVTMGCPVSGSAFHTFMRAVAALQLHLRSKDGVWYFYHRQVRSILTGGIISRLATPQTSATIASIKNKSQFYVPASEFSEDPLLSRIFHPVVEDPKSTSRGQIAAIEAYCKDLAGYIAGLISSGESGMQMELEFARAYYRTIVQIGGHKLEIAPATFFRLLESAVSLESAHFHGEPMKGLQIMGPLETRALDFRNLVILSCNEGVFPRHPVSSSFIPYELRRAFDLPTYEYQDAIWAYYFYRLIQRAQKLWLVYDSRLEGVRTGEESRYIKQLELHFGARTTRLVAGADPLCPNELEPVPKTPEDIAFIRSHPLSASAIRKYLDCPASFYYSFVRGLRESEELTDFLDSGMLGNVFHETMRRLYDKSGGKPESWTLTGRYLLALIGDPDRIRSIVEEEICKALKTFEVTGRNLIFENMIVEYVLVTLRRDLELTGRDGEFTVLGIEKEFHFEAEGLSFKGFIDRMDSFAPGSVRVVDYKTGKVEKNDVDITDANASGIVDKIFGEDSKSRPKIALQMYIYDRYVRERWPDRAVINSIYAPVAFFCDPVENVPMSGAFQALMDRKLGELACELTSPDIPFGHTSDTKTCAYCCFRTICGR